MSLNKMSDLPTFIDTLKMDHFINKLLIYEFTGCQSKLPPEPMLLSTKLFQIFLQFGLN